MGKLKRKLLRKFKAKRKKGFTLFEVLVVVIILGVLASIALPTYNKIVRKSRVSDGLSSLDMLAGAQEKYFLEHGYYAQNVGDLKAPFKQPNNNKGDIETINFTYSKRPLDNCIQATAKTGNYSLVRNYKKNKVVCMGEGCSDLSDFVEEIDASNYGSICPTENECKISQGDCGDRHFFASTCECKCPQSEYIHCAMAGGTFHPNCSCSGTCSSTCNSNGAVTQWHFTDTVCHSNSSIGGGTGGGLGTGGIVKPTDKEKEKSTGLTGGTKGSQGQGGGLEAYIKCGIVQERSVCKNNCWKLERECVDKAVTCSNLETLNQETCECEKGCNPQNKPTCASLNGGGYQICDPCPGGDCYHCGYQEASNAQAVCVNGKWTCQGSGTGPCQEVTGIVPVFEDCDGVGTVVGLGFNIVPGNTCGKKELAKVGCKQEITGGIPELLPSYSSTCTLKDGNECFDGEITNEGCQTGTSKRCFNCMWGPCENPTLPGCPSDDTVLTGSQTIACHEHNGINDPNLYCGTLTGTKKCNESTNYQWIWDFTGAICSYVDENSTQFVEGTEQCKKYKMNCEKDDVGIFQWVQTTQTEWVTDYGSGNNCITGDTTTVGCPAGKYKNCEDCHWTACTTMGSYCGGVPKPALYEPDGNGDQFFKKCHTLNGVTDSTKYCGVQIADDAICQNNEKWVWDYGPCQDVETFVTTRNCSVSGGISACLEQRLTSTLTCQQVGDSAQFLWYPRPNNRTWSACQIKQGSNYNCGYHVLTEGNSNQVCNYHVSGKCKLVTCPSDYTAVKGQGACVKAEKNHGLTSKTGYTNSNNPNGYQACYDCISVPSAWNASQQKYGCQGSGSWFLQGGGAIRCEVAATPLDFCTTGNTTDGVQLTSNTKDRGNFVHCVINTPNP